MTTLVLTEVVTTEQDRKVVIDQNLISYVNKQISDANIEMLELPCMDEEALAQVWEDSGALNIKGHFDWDGLRFITLGELVKYMLECVAYEGGPHDIWSESEITGYYVEEE